MRGIADDYTVAHNYVACHDNELPESERPEKAVTNSTNKNEFRIDPPKESLRAHAQQRRCGGFVPFRGCTVPPPVSIW